MTFPAGLATITVTGAHLLGFGGSPLSGEIVFTPSGVIADPAVSALLEGSAVAEVRSGVLVQPFVIAATDCVSPGFTYTITFRLQTPDGSPASLAPYPDVAIPSTLGASVDISALVPGAPPPSPTAFGTANTWAATQTFDGVPPLVIPAGATAGDVLTCDASGHASWQPVPAAGGGLPASGGAMTGWLAPAVVALADGATIAVNAALGNDFRVTLGGSRVIASPSNPADGQMIEFQLTQDGTGGRAVTWGGAYAFGADGAPVLSAGAGKTDIIGFKYNAARSAWLCTGARLGF